MIDPEYDAYRNMLNRTRWIPIEQLVDGALYVIHARNAYLGIWHAEKSAFIIAREKLGRIYLFNEYHWDTERGQGDAIVKDFGTAKPFILLDLLTNQPDDLLGFLLMQAKELPYMAAFQMVKALDDDA